MAEDRTKKKARQLAYYYRHRARINYATYRRRLRQRIAAKRAQVQKLEGYLEEKDTGRNGTGQDHQGDPHPDSSEA